MNDDKFQDVEFEEENTNDKTFGLNFSAENLTKNYKINDKKIKNEKKNLLKILSKIDENLLKMADSLIENIAFMCVILDGLIETIKKNGVKEFYRNGQNQFGYKKTVEVDIYNIMQKNYQSSMKILIDMLMKDNSNGEETEELKKYFARGRN